MVAPDMKILCEMRHFYDHNTLKMMPSVYALHEGYSVAAKHAYYDVHGLERLLFDCSKFAMSSDFLEFAKGYLDGHLNAKNLTAPEHYCISMVKERNTHGIFAHIGLTSKGIVIRKMNDIMLTGHEFTLENK